MTELPDWIPQDAWAGYVEMRQKIRKPMTDRARTLAIKTLDYLRADGNDPGGVLDQSTLNSWQGLFAIRVERRGLPRNKALSSLGTKGQATANNAQDWLEESA